MYSQPMNTMDSHQFDGQSLLSIISKETHLEFEKIYIETASKKYNGNKTLMAQELGIHRNTLHNLCKALKIKNLSFPPGN